MLGQQADAEVEVAAIQLVLKQMAMFEYIAFEPTLTKNRDENNLIFWIASEETLKKNRAENDAEPIGCSPCS